MLAQENWQTVTLDVQNSSSSTYLVLTFIQEGLSDGLRSVAIDNTTLLSQRCHDIGNINNILALYTLYKIEFTTLYLIMNNKVRLIL